jgi:DNA ligase D-like protein (predicted 3'-phosphoesterase)
MARFVVQEHDATARHFDFRLEVGRVLVSWAVPKGPSLDPAQRRLAMRVADHPRSWGGFEGITPGPRGSGAVIVWDEGDYDDLTDDGIRAALRAGHLRFALHGHKLRGGWALTRTRDEPREQWILVKMRDEHADRGGDVVRDRPESVVSGRTLEDVAASS